uniref:Uncharacterized protein n=1 Tax=Pristionchus pacificus TaxID=54126 RepID=A0A2A6BFA7_PRIPA|eukprot:PDM64567.1 hypothetical protein PRIPAC_52823 [Pristionchus pacificus]
MVTRASPLALRPEAERQRTQRGIFAYRERAFPFACKFRPAVWHVTEGGAYVTLAREISRERGGVDKMGEEEKAWMRYYPSHVV